MEEQWESFYSFHFLAESGTLEVGGIGATTIGIEEDCPPSFRLRRTNNVLVPLTSWP